MATPQFILDLRKKIGHDELWLSGATAVVLRQTKGKKGTTDEKASQSEVQEEVLLCRRADDGHWTPIGGILEPLEAPYLTAIRETLEETGVEIEVERMVACVVAGTVTYPNGDTVSYLDHVFRCHPVGGQAEVADEESTEVGWFPVNQLPEPMTRMHRHRIEVAVANPVDVVLDGPLEIIDMTAESSS